PRDPAVIGPQEKVFHPQARAAKTGNGPERMRGRPERVQKSAYCVAENRFWVSRTRGTEKAPVPIPITRLSKAVAEYMRGRFTPCPARRTYPRLASACNTPKIHRQCPRPRAVVSAPPRKVPRSVATTPIVPMAKPRWNESYP